MSNGLWIIPAELGTDYETLEYAQEACEAASFLLWAMSGRKFSGIYTVTERYTVAERTLEEKHFIAFSAAYALPTRVYLIDGRDFQHDRLRLRGKPVREIVAVNDVQTGDLIDDATYALWDHEVLKFPGGITGDLDVTYIYGSQPPTMGKMAARAMAIQFALLWSGMEDECTLPERVTSVTRQQVTWTILDSQDFISELRTGVYAVDLFLKAVNPDKARVKAKVFSPDIPRGNRRTTW